ncbi:MAG: cyclic nucleotide-binding domain-containing protein [bacterium]|nr:cyclic nucleotide-binding domain-containing protein [bacterium]
MRVAQAESAIQRYVAKFEMTSFLNDQLLSHLQLFHFPAYSTVFIEQDEQDFLYFLVEGQVQCHHYHLNGKLAVFAVSNPFTAIGDLEIINKEPVRSNVIATKDTTMLGIASHYVHRYGTEDPRFLRFIIGQLCDKLYKTNNFQINHLLPLVNRLAVYLLAQHSNEDGAVVLPDKEGLASLLGSSTRHLNRVLKDLVEGGGIRVDYPCIYILNRPMLEALTLE